MHISNSARRKVCALSIPTFLGWNTALNGLDTAQQAMSVISNNISNASTTGYHREVANVTEALPWPPNMGPNTTIVAGQTGQGSQVQSVGRVVNPYYEQLVRENTSSNTGYSTFLNNLQQVEGIFNEPGQTSLQAAINAYYGAWQTLSSSPDSTAARQSVISQAQSMADTFQAVQSQLQQMMSDINQQISGPAANQVSEVNQYAATLNQLNQQIAAIHAMGQAPNTLLDQRDTVLSKLSALGNLSVVTNTDGTVNVTFGSVPLVSYSSTAGGSTTSFTSADTSTVSSGAIWANVQTLQTVQGQLGQLSRLQQAIADGTNTQLQAGYQYNSSTSGVPLFQVTTGTATYGSVTANITTLTVPPSLTPAQLAAALSANAPGDGSNASAVAAQQNQATLVDSTGTALGATPNDYYAALISGLGAKTAAINSSANTASALLQQSQNLQQSVSGVNLNEEISNMLQFQNMYQAASKFLSTQNQMLQTLLQEV